jgi:hypothetical protein
LFRSLGEQFVHKIFRILLSGVARIVEWPLIGLMALIYAAQILTRKKKPELDVVSKNEQELIERRLAELLARTAARNLSDNSIREGDRTARRRPESRRA